MHVLPANHAQGVALSATRKGIKSVICMPAGAPILNVEATKGYGGEVILVPGVYDDAAKKCGRAYAGRRIHFCTFLLMMKR